MKAGKTTATAAAMTAATAKATNANTTQSQQIPPVQPTPQFQPQFQGNPTMDQSAIPPIPPSDPNILKSVNQLPTMFGGWVSRNPVGENLRKYDEIFKEILKDNNLEEILETRVFEGRQHSMPISAITLIANPTKGSEVVVYVFLVAASLQSLQPTTFNYSGQQIEIQNTPGQVWSQEMWEIMSRTIIAGGATGINVAHYAGFGVIPAEVKVDDKEHLQKLLSDGSSAIRFEINLRLGGANEFNLSCIPKTDKLSARIDFTPTPIEDTAGLPKRSDLSVTVVGSSNANIQQQIYNPSHIASQDITRVGGYVELLFNPSMNSYGMMPGMMPGMYDTRMFDARYVITDFSTGIDTMTLELLLFGIHQATVLNKSLAWAYAFRPTISRSGGTDVRDIGAIGLDIPGLVGKTANEGGDIIDTKTATFDEAAFLKLITATIRTDLIFSIDIPESTVDSWLLGILRQTTVSDSAYQLVIRAANTLTNNRFAQFFKGGPIIRDDNCRVHNGYYINKETGKPHDLRDLDYLCLLNIVGKSDHQYAIKYERTFSDTTTPIEIRLQERWKILQNVLGDTLKLTGYSNRYTFMPDFLIALSNAIQYEGFNIQPTNIQLIFGQQQRGFSQLGGLGLQSSMMQGAFNMVAPVMSHGGLAGFQSYVMPSGAFIR